MTPKRDTRRCPPSAGMDMLTISIPAEMLSASRRAFTGTICSQKVVRRGIWPRLTLKKGDSMKHYIECRNAEYDKIRVTFWRTRQDGFTLYKASVTPCKVETTQWYTCETCEPMNGYQYTLIEAKRASHKAEDSARVQLNWFVNRALELLSDRGFKTFLCGYDLSALITDIVRDIECEVH